MEVSAQQLAQLLGGVVEGDPSVTVSAPAKIEEGTVGTLTFLANPKYESFIYSTESSIVLVSRQFQPREPIAPTMIRVDDVYASMAQLMQQFGNDTGGTSADRGSAYIHGKASVADSASVGAFCVVEEGAVIGEEVVLYPNVYVGKNAVIGNGTVLYPGVRVYHECKIGEQSIIHANVVIGSDGFGYAPEPDGSFTKIPQVGNVEIGNKVEIGANSVVDRASMGSTRIKDGAKLDNLVHIAHNVEVGPHSALAAQVGIAGSTKLGAGCQLGGQAGVIGHISLGEGTLIQAQSGVIRGTEKGDKIQGSPAMPYTDYYRSFAIFQKLPQMARKLAKMEARLAELEGAGE
ncbi:MAG: UDP-3-O-(3-hydroxymyristoyl)glucosamine N-acyltransferase [Saprospiraceae bacterium]|nr:UDP-3-O-(3-hydroxymyristoyl)glucosamine N-acyltransferase [Saprospiraceae bacterium]